MTSVRTRFPAAAAIAVLLVLSQLAPRSADGAGLDALDGAARTAAQVAEYEALVARLRAGAADGDQDGRRAMFELGPAEGPYARYVEMAGRMATESGLPQVAPRLANWPHRGTISSPFAPRWGGFHNGLDIAAPFFTPVHAAAPGIVTVVGRPYATSGDLAITVQIVHGSNLATVYVHLDDRRLPVVKVGDRVSAGQLIAYVGTTGWSTGPHTHFMTVVNGRAVDPLGLLPP